MGLHSNRIKHVTVSNYTVRYSATQDATAYNKVPFAEFDYPMAIMFKNLPAYSMYCRNVDGLHLQNIKAFSIDGEKRAALAFDRVSNAELFSVESEVKTLTTPMIHLRNTQNIIAAFCRSSNTNKALFEVEDKTVKDLIVANNNLQPGQQEIIKVPAQKDDAVFEDFKTEIKYSVDKGEKVNGLHAYDLKNGPLKVNMNITKRGALQLCILILNNLQKPEKVLIKYEGITQEFLVDWKEWGWSPISLLKEYDHNKEVEFGIFSNQKDSHLKIANVYLRYQDVSKTD